MAEPFLAEIRIGSFNFAPRGWAACNGQLLPINQNQGLFSLLGTTFGGDGRVNFALPDFRGRAPIHVGGGHTLGERSGESAHTVTSTETPAHTHLVGANTGAPNVGAAAGNIFAANTNAYAASPDTAMAGGLVSSVGGSQAHQNMQPFLVLNFFIALQGIFPSPT